MSQLDSVDPMTRMDAVIALGAIADPGDTALFEKLAKGADDTLADGSSRLAADYGNARITPRH